MTVNIFMAVISYQILDSDKLILSTSTYFLPYISNLDRQLNHFCSFFSQTIESKVSSAWQILAKIFHGEKCQKWLHVLSSLKVLWPPYRWFLSGHPSPESPDLCASLPAYFPSPTPISPFLQQITNSLSVFYVTVWLYFFGLYRTNHKSPDLPSQHSWSKYISQIRNNK